MNPKQTLPPPPSITPDEIYYILSRHKWLVVIIATIALVAALLVRMLWSVPYESQARLMIKYVHEGKLPSQLESAMSSDRTGETVINSEIKILTSYDLASNVVEALGAARILGKTTLGTNSTEATNMSMRIEAANVIMGGFTPEPDRSDVIELKYAHRDADMVQPILKELIAAYLNKHRQVHQPDFLSFLQEQKDKVQASIVAIDQDLLSLKQQAGIDSTVDDARQLNGELRAKILSEKLEAEAEYASYTVTISNMQKQMPQAPVATTPTNAIASSNSAVPVPAGKISDYQKVCEQANNLQSELTQLLLKYTTNNSRVQSKQGEVARAESQKKDMEDKYPGLIAMKPVETKGMAPASAVPAIDPRIALREEITKAEALMAKIQTHVNQLAILETNTANVNSFSGRIAQRQMDRENAEGQLTFYSRKVEEEKVRDMDGIGNSNISEVEQPTPPGRNMKKTNKLIAGIFFGGLAFAFALPFIIELYFDRTLKRPLDVQARLKLPFFVSIPKQNGDGRARALKKPKKVALLPNAAATNGEPVNGEPQPAAPVNGHLALWEHHHGLQPFYDTLRDRLMTYFEMINLTHKPKLVAVTSCSEGAGVTTTAAGLASSLSETGDGNVLLVNMNARDGEAHHFYKGKLNCGLDEVLEKETRDTAFVQGNLYVAKENSEDDRLPRVLPKRFSHLLPKMKASDFDYIIFDMPPVSQISITPRLARFMDMVLLVVESGKTDRDAATRAAAVLSESKTNVGVVLNKNRSYGLRRNSHDI